MVEVVKLVMTAVAAAVATMIVVMLAVVAEAAVAAAAAMAVARMTDGTRRADVNFDVKHSCSYAYRPVVLCVLEGGQTMKWGDHQRGCVAMRVGYSY